jgi:hypothetical protein
MKPRDGGTVMKKKAKLFLTPQIITPKILPGQQCTFTTHTDGGHEFNPTYAADYERLAREGKPIPPRCTYVEPTEEETKAIVRKSMLESQRSRCIDNAEDAIKCMEEFMRNARRRLEDVKANPDAKDFTNQLRWMGLPETVLHELSWGMANASSRVQAAMAAVVDYMHLEKS